MWSPTTATGCLSWLHCTFPTASAARKGAARHRQPRSPRGRARRSSRSACRAARRRPLPASPRLRADRRGRAGRGRAGRPGAGRLSARLSYRRSPDRPKNARISAQPPSLAGGSTRSALASAAAVPSATARPRRAPDSISTSLSASPTASTRPGSIPFAAQKASTPVHLLTPKGRRLRWRPP